MPIFDWTNHRNVDLNDPYLYFIRVRSPSIEYRYVRKGSKACETNVFDGFHFVPFWIYIAAPFGGPFGAIFLLRKHKGPNVFQFAELRKGSISDPFWESPLDHVWDHFWKVLGNLENSGILKKSMEKSKESGKLPKVPND